MSNELKVLKPQVTRKEAASRRIPMIIVEEATVVNEGLPMILTPEQIDKIKSVVVYSAKQTAIAAGQVAGVVIVGCVKVVFWFGRSIALSIWRGVNKWIEADRRRLNDLDNDWPTYNRAPVVNVDVNVKGDATVNVNINVES